MQVTLAALGSGRWDTLTGQVQARLLQAQCILGAPRLLADLPAECTKNRIAATTANQLLAAIRREGLERSVVVYSGDSGFYSGARSLIPLLEAEKIEYTLLPGLSSVQMLAALLGRPWQDWLLVSAHGVDCDPVAAVMQGRPAFFLTGGALDPATLCKRLVEAGLGQLPVTVGENLYRPQQRITTLTARDCVEKRFAPLSVLLAEAAPMPPRRSPGLPDSAFVRGKVPMTKQLVRTAILAKLAVAPEHVLWDVGAGTGSVSVELGLAAPKGRVYAVEYKPEACDLIRQNREAFHAWNLELVPGRAPEALQALPAPDAVFIGGSGGAMDAIVQAALEKNPHARLCISAIALETVQAALTALSARDVPATVTQLAVSETRPAGGLNLLMANNPIFLITGNCND